MNNSRRKFLYKSSLLTLAGIGSQLFSKNIMALKPVEKFFSEGFILPGLPYGYDALEPFIDSMTMEIHHKKHHQAYVDNLNKALAAADVKGSLEEILKNISKYSPAIRNNAGGHWNHSFFWKLMKAGGGFPDGKIVKVIEDSFGTIDSFKTQMEEAGLKRFGSGWSWLIVDANKKLVIGSTPNQDNPLMDVSELKGTPILGIDVWEHAYYLKYQNRRPDYLKAFWNVVNWSEVAKNYEAAK